MVEAAGSAQSVRAAAQAWELETRWVTLAAHSRLPALAKTKVGEWIARQKTLAELVKILPAAWVMARHRLAIAAGFEFVVQRLSQRCLADRQPHKG